MSSDLLICGQLKKSHGNVCFVYINLVTTVRLVKQLMKQHCCVESAKDSCEGRNILNLLRKSAGFWISHTEGDTFGTV